MIVIDSGQSRADPTFTMLPLKVLLLLAVTVEVQSQGYSSVFTQHCPQPYWNNITGFISKILSPTDPMVPPITRDLELFHLPNPTQLMGDCVKFDTTKQRAIYQFARDTFLECLPSEWHGFVSPVQNIMDYRKTLCEKPDVIAACSKLKPSDPNDCGKDGPSVAKDFATTDNPETSMKDFCKIFSLVIDCVPSVYGKCQSEAKSVIQEAYRKLRLPACGSAHVLVTNWVLLAALAIKNIFHD